MMASDAPCILPNASHGTRRVSLLNLGPDLVHAGLGVGEIRLVVRIRLEVTEYIVKIGPDVVKITLKNITIRVVNEGESLVEIDI